MMTGEGIGIAGERWRRNQDKGAQQGEVRESLHDVLQSSAFDVYEPNLAKRL